MNSKLKEATTLFFIQIILYGILCINFRAVAQAQYHVAAAAEYGTVPDDFLEVKSIKLDTNPVTALQFQTIDAMDALSNTTYLSSGKPLYFSVVGNRSHTT